VLEAEITIFNISKALHALGCSRAHL
jgi:hypothetical protein